VRAMSRARDAALWPNPDRTSGDVRFRGAVVSRRPIQFRARTVTRRSPHPQECNLPRRGCCSPIRPPPIDTHHRHYGRAVWIDPVVLGAITISWNNIRVPVRCWPCHGHRDDKPHPWFTNDFGLPRMGCGIKRPQASQHQGRSESERCGHYPHFLGLLEANQRAPAHDRSSCARLKP
jgi:hypothetical protein